MAINFNFVKGVDAPTWQWLPFYGSGGVTYHGFDSDYDGVRYIYTIAQTGSASTTASTLQLWRFDTWGHAWQYLTAVTSGNRGASLAYDEIRNIIIVTHGSALTSWQVFNLNKTAISICGVSCASWAITTMTPVLPAGADYGATIVAIKTTQIPSIAEDGALSVGTTATNIADTSIATAFTDQMIGQQIKITSGALNGQRRFITAVVDANNLTVGTAFGSIPVVGVTYEITLPSGTATAGAATTLTDSSATWTVNQYANSDVVIVSGTGAGQKKRIASNTATVLTLAAQ